MKKSILLLALFIASLFSINAQVITGRIIDNNSNPVEFATIILQTTDSVYVNSVYSDSVGVFSIKSELNNFRLIVQHLMHEVSEDTYSRQNVGDVLLMDRENTLGEVVISGERPLVRVIDGRITYDMPQLIQGKVVSNAYESLLQLPGVREQNEALSLAGASSLTVILNGKPTTMTGAQLIELLKNTPAERIEKAEVMYSAPPQYHVRGAAINLILAGGTSETPTLQGQINGAYSQYHYDDYTTGLSLLYSTPKYSMDFLYSFGYIGHYNGLDLYSDHLYNGTAYNIEQHNRGYSRYTAHNIRLGNEFHLGGNNKLSLVYTGMVKPWQHAQEASEGTFSNSDNKKGTDSPIQMHNAALSYSSGFGLDAGVDYTFYKSHTTQNYKENMVSKEDAFKALTKQDINRLSAYVDQTHAISDWTLNYGAQFMYASDKSSQNYESLTGKDLSASNSYSHLKEYTYNLYTGFEKSFSERLSATFSLTGEYYKYGDFDEWSLFPAFELTYMASPDHIFQMSLSSDKSYPDYWSLTSSIGYLNGYTEIHGNPLLRPYKDYSGQLNYIFKRKYVLTAYMNYEDDYFVQLPYQSPDKLALIYKTTNFKYNEKIGLNLMVPFTVGSFLDSRLTLNGFYHKVKSNDFHGASFDNDNFAFYTSLNNTLNISSNPNIKMELTGSYITKNIQGPSEISKMYKVDAGIKWGFANDKGEVRIKVNDIFNSWSPDSWSMKFDNQNLRMHIIPDSRYVSLSFTYKFGGYKEKKHKDVDTSRFIKE